MRAEPEVIAQALALHDFNTAEKSCGTFSGLSIGRAGSNGRLRRLGGENFGLCKQYAFYIHGPDARIACSQRTRVTGAFTSSGSKQNGVQSITVRLRRRGRLPARCRSALYEPIFGLHLTHQAANGHSLDPDL